MGIELFWYGDEKNVFLLEFEGDWTWDDLTAVIKTVRRLSLGRRELLGAILDLPAGWRLPSTSLFHREGIQQFRELLQMCSSGQGRGPIVIVGMGGIIRTLIDALGRLNRHALSNLHFAATMSEAREIMQTQLQQSAP